MKKPVFNANEYPRNDSVCIHFTTQEQLDAFCKYMNRIGRRWCSGDRYNDLNIEDKYGDETVYYFNAGSYGSIRRAEDNGVLILDGDEFDWGEGTQREYEVTLTFDQLFGE